MSTIEATIVAQSTVLEIFSAVESPGTGEQVLSYDQFNTRHQLNAASTPAATKVYGEKLTGPQSLDFTALVRSIGGTIDASGLTLQVLRLVNLSATDDVDFDDGGANPYQVNAGDPIRIPPGGEALLYYNDELTDVAAGAKDVDITAAAGEDFQLTLIFG